MREGPSGDASVLSLIFLEAVAEPIKAIVVPADIAGPAATSATELN
jgi:hypothetical protein